MPNFHLMQKDLYTQNWRNAQLFAFPVQGLIIPNESYKYCHVELVQKSVFLKRYTDLKDHTPFVPETIALIDLAQLSKGSTQDHRGHENALKGMKEFLGALHVMVFKKGKGEKKIAISNSNHLEVEEGLTPCYAIGHNGLISLYNRDNDLVENYLEIEGLINQAEWIELFSTPIHQRNARHKVIFKLLEISYYSSNDIHAYSRMTDWFIALNHSLRKDNDENLDCSDMGRRLQVIFKNFLQIDIFGKKITTGFGDLYKRVRNKTQHGILSSDIELSPVEVDDYRALKRLFFGWICFLVENENARSMASIGEIVDWLEAYRPTT